MIYVHAYKGTRLGNWLFHCAAAASLGNDFRVIPGSSQIKQAFLTNPLLKKFKIADEAPKACPWYNQNMDKYEKIPYSGTGDFAIVGDFQSTFFFDEKIARSIFAWPESIVAELRTKYSSLLSIPNITAIHVRRGDYLKIPHRLPFVGKKYFREIIHNRIPDVSNYLVCSDDMNWCKRFFPVAFPGKTFHFIEGNSPLEDMCLMSLCQNIISSNSTFSWWASWLNVNPNKLVFMPAEWIGISPRRRGLPWDGLYYHGA